MRLRWMTLVFVAAFGGCSWFSSPQRYSVFFQPYSAEIDDQARLTVREAANYAQSHVLLRIEVSGFAAPPDPKLDVDGLSAQRADAVKQLLVADGVAPARITTVANGIVDPDPLPSLAVRRVDISFGPAATAATAAAVVGFR